MIFHLSRLGERDNVVDITTRYILDGSGFETRLVQVIFFNLRIPSIL